MAVNPVADLQAWAEPHLFYGGLAIVAVGILVVAGLLSALWGGVLAALLGVGIVVDVIAHDIEH